MGFSFLKNDGDVATISKAAGELVTAQTAGLAAGVVVSMQPDASGKSSPMQAGAAAMKACQAQGGSRGICASAAGAAAGVVAQFDKATLQEVKAVSKTAALAAGADADAADIAADRAGNEVREVKVEDRTDPRPLIAKVDSLVAAMVPTGASLDDTVVETKFMAVASKASEKTVVEAT